MLKHWLEICIYDEREYWYAEACQVSEKDIEEIRSGNISKYYTKRTKCIGYRFFDAEIKAFSNDWSDLSGKRHHTKKSFSDWPHTNETEWTFFRTEMEKAIKLLGRYPKIEDQDKII